MKKLIWVSLGMMSLLLPGHTYREHGRNESNSGSFRSSYVPVSARNPHYFELSDGTPYVPVGLNLCWPRFIEEEAAGLAKMEMYFRQLSKNGGNYTRIWLSAPFYEVEHTHAGRFDQAKVRRIAAVLDLAGKHGVKVKLCFENFRRLLNYPPKFPGSAPFDRPVYHTSHGGPLEDMNDYLQTETGKKLFRDRLTFLQKHIGNHPAIFGWELWNEMDAVQGKGWQTWTDEMLRQLEKQFPRHLHMQSLGSFDQADKYDMYQSVCALPDNQVAQVHRYLDPAATLEACKGPMDVLAADAVGQLLSYQLSKPVIVSEIGAVEANHAGPSKLYEKDKAGVLLHDLLFAPFFTGAAGPGQSWHWDSYVEKNNLWHHFGRFAEAIKGINPVTEAFTPFQINHSGLRTYGLRSKTTTLLWCRDAANTWQMELVAGKSPETLKGLTLTVDSWRPEGKKASVSFYDPWQHKWSKSTPLTATLSLPDFSRSLVVKLSY